MWYDEQGNSMFALVPLTDVLEELVELLMGSGIEILVSRRPEDGQENAGEEPIVEAMPVRRGFCRQHRSN